MQSSLFDGSIRRAVFSPDRRYRYLLEIRWGDGPPVNFLMLNPSTADENANDPTVERCERRARAWGFPAVVVTNLFAIRSTDPRGMLKADDPVGPNNDAFIRRVAVNSSLVVCAWGNHGSHLGRADAVRHLLLPMSLKCLRVAKAGEPCHPLYLPYSLKPVPHLWQELSQPSLAGTPSSTLSGEVFLPHPRVKATNASEQRFVVRSAMAEMDLTYRNLTQADTDAVQGFFDSQKGAFDSTWTFVIGASTFTAMRFLADELRWEETLPNRWSTRLRCAGFHPTVTGTPAAFPLLDSAAVTQRPWAKRRTFETNYNYIEVGVRHSLAMRGGGLVNLPLVAVRAWDVQYQSITPTEADRLVKFFISKNGRFGSFDFADPDTATVYTGCRFGSDDLDLEVQYVGFNNCSTAVSVEKV